MERRGHVVVISYPATGHTNPMLQFSKNLASRGLLVTFVNFNFNHSRIMQAKESVQRLKLDIRFECIPDGLPQGDLAQDTNINPAVFKHMQDNMDGSGLEHLINRLNASADAPPVSCIIYNSFLPWICLKIGIAEERWDWDSSRMPESVTIPDLPELKLWELPSPFRDTTGFLNYYLRQFESVRDASWVIANTFYELEHEMIDSIRGKGVPFLSIGPSIPSVFLDGRNPEDTQWERIHGKRRTVWNGWRSRRRCRCGQRFVWVIRPPPGHAHIGEVLPAGFLEENERKGLVVEWCIQLEVLSHPSVGVFMSHCGWNSTLDALSLGIPMLTLGIWTDQPTNSKFVADVWKTGLKLRAGEDGVVGREEIERCMRLAVDGIGEQGKKLRNNALKWRNLCRSAASEGGSSDINMNQLVDDIVAKAKE
ncbi:hypothetical protein KI387_043663 [Taxus chinensis]|uniref:Glycosyltransferase N-terminal domain-containing protein n=1 Tax=Taxus chinensis TaxID=29808 RepID=A0AA38F6T4_TAXCH|nr:hypothetical protein KI387_043663 [Taxus chinensis]